MRNRLDVFINVRGGGITGQAGAASQGVARALKTMFGLTSEPEPAPPGVDGQPAAPAEGGMSKKLRDSGYLTRDSRMKERKKYGRKGARRSFQFSKALTKSKAHGRTAVGFLGRLSSPRPPPACPSPPSTRPRRARPPAPGPHTGP